MLQSSTSSPSLFIMIITPSSFIRESSSGFLPQILCTCLWNRIFGSSNSYIMKNKGFFIITKVIYELVYSFFHFSLLKVQDKYCSKTCIRRLDVWHLLSLQPIGLLVLFSIGHLTLTKINMFRNAIKSEYWVCIQSVVWFRQQMNLGNIFRSWRSQYLIC